jgi:hypothetical protein
MGIALHQCHPQQQCVGVPDRRPGARLARLQDVSCDRRNPFISLVADISVADGRVLRCSILEFNNISGPIKLTTSQVSVLEDLDVVANSNTIDPTTSSECKKTDTVHGLTICVVCR